MAYITKAEVISEFKDIAIEDSGTAVTSSDVTAFIAQVEAYINARIATKYSTPIVLETSPKAFLIMQMISTYGVVCRIKRILEVKQADPKVQQNVVGMDYCKEFDSMLKQILDGTLQLPDATVDNPSGGVSSYNYENDIEGEFKVDETQW